MQTWDEAVSRYQLTRARRAPMTVVREKAVVKWMAPYLSGLPIEQVTRRRIEDVREAAIVAEWGPHSVNHALATIRQVLRAAERWEWIPFAPRVYMEKRPQGRVRWLTREQARALVAACPPVLGQMVRMALATGLRKATMRQMDWEWVDLEGATLHVPGKFMKGRATVSLPLTAAALEVLRERAGVHPRWVFSYGDAPVHDPSCRAFRDALKVAGISNFRWHDLRHTWASWHAQGGTSLAVLQQLGGWRTIEMVMRYAHLDTDTLRTAAARVQGF